jgi:cytoskeletal protein CcmA (bactofilin family)
MRAAARPARGVACESEWGVSTLIFTRKPDSVVDAQSSTRESSAREGRPAVSVVSVIGPDLVVTGTLETTGDLRIEGDVQGDVYAARIVVGDQARVVGDMVADEIDIAGLVQGNIRGNSVTFRTGSQVEGEILHRKLMVEQGAYFEGKSRRSDNPTGQG